MPKKILNKSAVAMALRELDRWQGKLTWSAYCQRVAKVLGVDSISRHTLYQNGQIGMAFRQRQRNMRSESVVGTSDFTLEVAVRRVADLEAQVARLEATNGLLIEQFVRWQYNAYANNVRMDALSLDAPLPPVNRAGRRRVR